MSLSRVLRLHTEISDVERDIRKLTVISSTYDNLPGIEKAIEYLQCRVRNLERDLSQEIIEVEGGQIGLD